MTLALALRACDGLVLGADSRVSQFQASEGALPALITKDVSEKFLQVNRDVGVLTYGLATPGYNGISRLVASAKQNSSGAYATFTGIANEATAIFKAEFEGWVKSQPSPEAVAGIAPPGFILAGYDSQELNQFRVASYQGPAFARQETLPPVFIAGQWHISQYLLRTAYFPELDVKNLVDLAVFLFLETMTIETTVGGPIQLATVTLDRGFQRLHEDDIHAIIRRLQRRIVMFNRALFRPFIAGRG